MPIVGSVLVYTLHGESDQYPDLPNFLAYMLRSATPLHVHQRFGLSTQYTIQESVQKLQKKEMCYIEKGVEVLSALKNANALGCIFAHKHDITTYLLENLTPSSYVMYAKIHKSFTGHVTQSTLDVRMCHPQGMSAPFQNYLETDQNACDQLAWEEQGEYNQINFHPLRS